MDLSTTYLGFRLPHPLMPGASPLVDSLDTVRRLEDAGAAAIVMHSLFEEQIVQEQVATIGQRDRHSYSFGEASSYLPEPDEYALGPRGYLEQIRRIKEAVRIPLIASLNGSTLGGWLEYAGLIEQAGAAALELNAYTLPTDPRVEAAAIEDQLLEVVRTVREAIRIPLAVKLSPFYTSLAHVALRIDQRAVEGLVLFNRFYQPGIDIEELGIDRQLRLSDSSELPLRLRWVALLRGKLKASLAVSGGVHSVGDVVQAVMAGADAVQCVSALLRQGPGRLAELRRELAEWLEAHEYDSLKQMQGSMSYETCPDPRAYDRANYIRLLQSWQDAP